MSFKKVIANAAMLSGVRLLRLAAQFVAIPILSRLLSPAEYGLVAIAMPFALFAMLIADAGIGMSLVRTPASERGTWSTCFWLSCLLGAVLGLLMAACAPLAAHIFHEPALTGMILALSFVVFAQAVHLIPVAALQQAQRFRTIAVIEIAATGISLTTALVMAYHGAGAWALIGQQIAYFAVRTSSICYLSPFRPLMVFRRSEVMEHITFGRNVLGNGLITYFARSFDNWVVGKTLGAALLGFYAMAFQFARLPVLIVAGPLQYVLYSQLAKLKGDRAAIAHHFLLATRVVAIVIFPIMGLAAIAHAPLFAFLLSAKWAQAGILFMLLAPATAVQAVLAISETAVYALGRSEIQLRSAAEYTALWIAALVIAVQWGVVPAAIAYSACTLLYQLRYLALALPLMGINVHNYFSAWLMPLIATGLGIAAYWATTHVSMEDWLRVMIAAGLALTAFALSLLMQRELLMAALRQWQKPGSEPSPLIEAGIE